MYRYILSYLSLCLLLISLFLILSYLFHAGFGFVYIEWLGWQIQSHVFLLLLLFFVLGAGFIFIWYSVEKLIQRYVYRYQLPKSFQALHPYERLWLVWLLRVDGLEYAQFFRTYKNSALLYPLIQARLLLAQGQYEQAKDWLRKHKSPLFELNELLKIEIALAQHQDESVLERLNFLSVHPVSLWLKPLERSYQRDILSKWAELAIRQPWWLYQHACIQQFDSTQRIAWLNALLSHHQLNQNQLESPSLDFIAWCQIESHYHIWIMTEQQILLKIMAYYPQLQLKTIDLAQHLLAEQFSPDVLYIWLSKVLKSNIYPSSSVDTPLLIQLEQRILSWQTQYPAQPSLNFALWHIYQQQQRIEEADQLLLNYPNDVYMAYLRLQQALPTMQSRQDDLTLLLHYSKQDFDLGL